MSNKARDRFKRKVRELSRRNNPYSMYQVIQELNKYLQGWVGYFRIQEFKYLFRNFDTWIRSRLSSTQLKKWKKPIKFQRIMIKVGFDPRKANRTWVRMNKWPSVTRGEVRFVMNNEWFSKLGLISLHNFALATLKRSPYAPKTPSMAPTAPPTPLPTVPYRPYSAPAHPR